MKISNVQSKENQNSWRLSSTAAREIIAADKEKEVLKVEKSEKISYK